jgi:hypothetical protein
LAVADRIRYLLRVARSVGYAALAGALMVLPSRLLHERFPRFPDVRWGDAVAAVAICFAVIQFADMKMLAEVMSTQFVGSFPKNLRDVTRVVAEAKRDLHVMVDFVGYGIYSAHAEYCNYVREIEDALARGVSVKLVIYDDHLSEQEGRTQIPDGEEAFRNECKADRFREYFEANRGVERPTSSAGLRAILQKRQRHDMDSLVSKGACVRIHPDRSAFFLWLRDDEQAVFAFRSIGNTERGLSFKTSDGNLVRQFEDIFDTRWKESTEQQQQTVSA